MAETDRDPAATALTESAVEPLPRHHWLSRLLSVTAKLLITVAGLAVFILALELLKKGAAGIAPLFQSLHVDGVWDSLGMGWLMAYVVLSGSPVAAISLTLYSGQVISDIQAFAMITGSRLGASFIVLFIGFLYYLRGHQRVASISIGVLSLLVTATVYLPAMALGYASLTYGWLDRVQFGRPGALNSVIDVVYDPVVNWLAASLPRWALFILGILTLLTAFQVFDKALPEVNPESTGFQRIADLIYRPQVMLLLGLAVTSITLSVSVSLSILVPLSARGYIRRENLIPYVMGCNISTFIDTLFAALLLNTPRAFTIVLTEMLSVAVLSLLILVLMYRPYQAAVERLLEWTLRDRRTLALFVLLMTLVPLGLLLS